MFIQTRESDDDTKKWGDNIVTGTLSNWKWMDPLSRLAEIGNPPENALLSQWLPSEYKVSIF